MGVGTLEIAGQKKVCGNSYCLQRNKRSGFQYKQISFLIFVIVCLHCWLSLSSFVVVGRHRLSSSFIFVVGRCHRQSLMLSFLNVRRLFISSSSSSLLLSLSRNLVVARNLLTVFVVVNVVVVVSSSSSLLLSSSCHHQCHRLPSLSPCQNQPPLSARNASIQKVGC